jgi:hypothetical protein
MSGDWLEALGQDEASFRENDDRLGTLLDNRVGEHGCRRAAAARLVRGLVRDLTNHLHAHVPVFPG